MQSCHVERGDIFGFLITFSRRYVEDGDVMWRM